MAMAGESDTAQASCSARRGSLVPSAPALSICILVLDDAAMAVACLDSLRRPGACPPGTEFVVVANGTPSDQCEALVLHDDVVLVVNEMNLGFATGANQAASVARAPLLVFLNDDSTVEDGCIDALVAAASADPAIGAVGARILWGDGSVQEAGSVIWRDGWTAHVGEGLEPAAFDQPRDVDYTSANGLLVTRRAWDAVGGFDERFYPAYFEDVDLCLALVTSGFRVRYEPSARIVHLGSKSTTGVFRLFLFSRNHTLLVEKWGRVLERFEPPPPKDSGPKFEAAVRRAVGRTAAQQRPVDTAVEPRSSTAAGPSPVALDPLGAAQALAAEYHDYLEQRVAAGDRRVTMLETYVSGLWGVRFRRWIGGALARRRQRGTPG